MPPPAPPAAPAAAGSLVAGTGPVPTSDEQAAASYKHLLRESVRLHPETAPSFRDMVGDDALIPTTALKFVKRVGSGAFCRVDICDLVMGPPGTPPRRVAVKRLSAASDAVSLVDLAVEARLLRTLRHPYITQYIGVGTDAGGEAYLVEEYVAGGTLNRAVSRQSVRPHKTLFTVQQAATWALQIAQALAYLHGSNPVVIHRDLKLANILLRDVPPPPDAPPGTPPRRDAALCDFGLSSSIINPALAKRSDVNVGVAGKGGGALPPVAPVPRGGAGVAIAGGDVRGRSASPDGGGGANGGAPAPLGARRSSVGPDARRDTAVRHQFARVSRGEEMSDADVAGRSAELGAALSGYTPSRGPRDGRGRAGRARGGGGGGGVPTLITSSKSPVGDLTGRTGSYMYMAPEVTRSRPYNEKADVFSFGVVLYQLFARQTFSAVLLMLSRGDPVDCEIYAEKVARGYRVPIPSRWPDAVRELVAACWAQDPADRPSMADVAAQLGQLADAGCFDAWDGARVKAIEAAGCWACCGVM